MTLPKIAVIGNGLAAKTFLYAFQKLNLGHPVDVLHFCSENQAPASATSLGVVAMKGAKRGTWLGNALLDGKEALERWGKQENIQALRSGTFYDLDMANYHAFATKRYIYIYMEEKKVAGSRIYTLVGVIIFGTLAYVMFMNYFSYITTDYAKECLEQGGKWMPASEECIFDKSSQ